MKEKSSKPDKWPQNRNPQLEELDDKIIAAAFRKTAFLAEYDLSEHKTMIIDGLFALLHMATNVSDIDIVDNMNKALLCFESHYMFIENIEKEYLSQTEKYHGSNN
jgi:hypothetical protein